MVNELAFVILYGLSLSASQATCDITSEQIVNWIKSGSIPAQITPSNKEIDEFVSAVEVKIAKTNEAKSEVETNRKTEEKKKDEKGNKVTEVNVKQNAETVNEKEKKKEEIIQKTGQLNIKENTEITNEAEKKERKKAEEKKKEEEKKKAEEKKKEEEKKKAEEKKKEEEKRKEDRKKFLKMKNMCVRLMDGLSKSTKFTSSFLRGQVTWNGAHRQDKKAVVKDNMFACNFEDEQSKFLSVVFLPSGNAEPAARYFVIQNASAEDEHFRFLGIYQPDEKKFRRTVSFEKPDGTILRSLLREERDVHLSRYRSNTSSNKGSNSRKNP